jgi:hypothetical protein
MQRKILQWILRIGGGAAVAIALVHITLGPRAIPGSVPVNATMDSEDRFYATLFLAYGVALLWCVREVERKSQVVGFLAATLFAGGVARLISMVAVGLPNAFFMAMTALELLLPPVILGLLRATGREEERIDKS